MGFYLVRIIISSSFIQNIVLRSTYIMARWKGMELTANSIWRSLHSLVKTENLNDAKL